MSTSRPPPPGSEPPPVTLRDLAEARALRAQLDPACLDPEQSPGAWLFEPEVQQWIARLIDEDMAPFRAALPPDAARALRQEIELAYHTDPAFLELLGRIRPRAARERSGKEIKGAPAGAGKVVAFRPKKAAGEGQ